jgi:hypothetical protein
MGINISVSKVTGIIEDTWRGKPATFHTTERLDWFDTYRHSGDRDFVIENEFEFIDEQTENGLARPKDFNKCREWVKSKIYEGNQQRLLDALDKIEADETLCFTWSW